MVVFQRRLNLELKRALNHLQSGEYIQFRRGRSPISKWVYSNGCQAFKQKKRGRQSTAQKLRESSSHYKGIRFPARSLPQSAVGTTHTDGGRIRYVGARAARRNAAVLFSSSGKSREYAKRVPHPLIGRSQSLDRTAFPACFCRSGTIPWVMGLSFPFPLPSVFRSRLSPRSRRWSVQLHFQPKESCRCTRPSIH